MLGDSQSYLDTDEIREKVYESLLINQHVVSIADARIAAGRGEVAAIGQFCLHNFVRESAGSFWP